MKGRRKKKKVLNFWKLLHLDFKSCKSISIKYSTSSCWFTNDITHKWPIHIETTLDKINILNWITKIKCKWKYAAPGFPDIYRFNVIQIRSINNWEKIIAVWYNLLIMKSCWIVLILLTVSISLFIYFVNLLLKIILRFFFYHSSRKNIQ